MIDGAMDWLRTDRGLAVVLVAFTLLVSCSAVLSVAAYLRVDSDSARTTSALCALRGDLEARVRQTDQFLHEHPEGFAGLPASTLRVSAEGQVRTIQALGGLDC